MFLYVNKLQEIEDKQKSCQKSFRYQTYFAVGKLETRLNLCNSAVYNIKYFGKLATYDDEKTFSKYLLFLCIFHVSISVFGLYLFINMILSIKEDMKFVCLI